MRRVLTTALAATLAAGGLLLAQDTAKKDSPRPVMREAERARVARGEKLYEVQCAICHYATTTEPKIGPGLKGLVKRGKFADGKKVDDAGLRRWIEKGGKNMPAYEETLKPAEINALVAYLKTL